MFKERKSVEEVEEGKYLSPKFDEKGLIPVITTDYQTKEILMHGYMNAEALKKTITTKEAHYCPEISHFQNSNTMGLSHNLENPWRSRPRNNNNVSEIRKSQINCLPVIFRAVFLFTSSETWTNKGIQACQRAHIKTAWNKTNQSGRPDSR